MANNDPAIKAALVLSGGGAFGAYEVGVINALYGGHSPATNKTPLDADIFAGTSVGSFNAAVLAMNIGGAAASAKRLNDLWMEKIADRGDGRGNGVYRIRGLDVGSYLDPRIPGSPMEQLTRIFGDAGVFGSLAARSAEQFVTRAGSPFSRISALIDISVFLNTDPFERLVKSSIDPSALRESTKELSVTATNWTNGEPEGFNFREMTHKQTWDAIRASAAIPGLFPAVTMGREVFIDGGVVMNTPIKPAVDNGATELHVISLDPTVPDLHRAYTGATLDVLNRVYTAMVAGNISEDIESARWVNEGIEAIESIEAGEKFDSHDGKRFVEVAGVIRQRLEADGIFPRKLTIHRYYPKQALGGILGMLNFDLSAIQDMIARGDRDARSHNCKEEGCVVPNTAAQARTAAVQGNVDQ